MTQRDQTISSINGSSNRFCKPNVNSVATGEGGRGDELRLVPTPVEANVTLYLYEYLHANLVLHFSCLVHLVCFSK